MKATHKGRAGSGLWAVAAGLMISLGFFGLTSRQIAEVSRVARSDIDTDKRKMLGGVP